MVIRTFPSPFIWATPRHRAGCAIDFLKLKAPECVSQERASSEEERKDPSGVDALRTVLRALSRHLEGV